MCGNGMVRAVSCRTVLARTGSPGPWTASRIRRPRWVRDSVRGDHPRSPASRSASACGSLGQDRVEGRELGAGAGQVTRHVAKEQLNPPGAGAGRAAAAAQHGGAVTGPRPARASLPR